MRPADSSVRAVAFDDTVAEKAPVQIMSVSSPTPIEQLPDRKLSCTSTPSSDGCSVKPAGELDDNAERQDSGVATMLASKELRPIRTTDSQSAQSLKSPRSVPSIIVDEQSGRPSSRWSERRWAGLRGRKSSTDSDVKMAPPPTPPVEAPFHGITLSIPTGSFEDLSVTSMEFSKRGSIVSNVSNDNRENKLSTPSENKPTTSSGLSDSAVNARRTERTDRTETKRMRSSQSLRVRPTSSASRAISADEDLLSRRVRLMYEKGEEDVSDAELSKAIAADNGVLWEENTPTEGGTDVVSDANVSTDAKSINSVGQTNGSIKRHTHELAGGIEDWHDIGAGEVDRYGFIIPRCNAHSGESAPEPHIQRVSTSLLLASETPRRKHTVRRAPSTVASNRSFSGRPPGRKMSDVSARPTSSQSAYSSLQRSASRFRYATNRLPHNRDRRLRDEAGDMLTLPFEPIATNDEVDTPASRAMRRKEWEREEKWTKMAKPIKKTPDGGGMTFEFDTKSSKLMERTWKGIPDRWRATAWYSFLATSAKKRVDSPTEEELMQAFHDFQHMSSPDDVQIDIDVPRTISSHIMFRRRYRGGQRLLFRVLHAMSLYFPETGYVQGMAALAATLLSYFDEEHAFVMLVRLWQLRGLDRLYRSGFAGLMEALDDFEKDWLAGGEVAAKLNELGIPPTAYGTRWYLTLFNYSIPFPAQLRVWDVFMLLGDSEIPASSQPPLSPANGNGGQPAASPFGRSLDVLHATSAALIDGMREIILESDFENAMKVLTSWVPIKDIELFMRVAKAEWKVHRKKAT
ncbi:TBC domain protein, putative [Paecilomyces variotii No. 5]|uniref:TBC domain protein, putative n=1 Tax=Byssochlamys spectabilis (strain No. 5 / NBRC 109023) TaxID=1356009 RepID=V5FZV3_BYSSN|nr:TBC domain protein, putative [Paecilomyces variotii No. 5]